MKHTQVTVTQLHNPIVMEILRKCHIDPDGIAGSFNLRIIPVSQPLYRPGYQKPVRSVSIELACWLIDDATDVDFLETSTIAITHKCENYQEFSSRVDSLILELQTLREQAKKIFELRSL